MKVRTIDQYCKSEAGGYKKFIKQKEDHLKSIETERKERIRAARKTAQHVAWAS